MSSSTNSDSSSSSVGEYVIANTIVLSALYGLIFLKSMKHVWMSLHSEKTQSSERVSLLDGGAPHYLTSSGGNLAANQKGNRQSQQSQSHTSLKVNDEHSMSSNRTLLRFYVVCALFSLARSVTWGLNARYNFIDDSKIQLAVVAVPSLMYFVMLFILAHGWWLAFEKLTRQQHGMRKPCTFIMAALWIGTIAFYFYMVASGSLSHHGQSDLMMGYTAALFANVGLLFMFVGVGVHKRLAGLPYNFRGVATLRRRVFIITSTVGPSCLLRSLFIVLQLIPNNNDFTKFVQGEYFPFFFYAMFEFVPIVIVIFILHDDTEPDANAEYVQQTPAVVVPELKRSTEDLGNRGSITPTYSHRHSYQGSSNASTIAPLGLNVTGRRAIGTPSPPVLPSPVPGGTTDQNTSGSCLSPSSQQGSRQRVDPAMVDTADSNNSQTSLSVPNSGLSNNRTSSEEDITRLPHRYLQA